MHRQIRSAPLTTNAGIPYPQYVRRVSDRRGGRELISCLKSVVRRERHTIYMKLISYSLSSPLLALLPLPPGACAVPAQSPLGPAFLHPDGMAQ